MCRPVRCSTYGTYSTYAPGRRAAKKAADGVGKGFAGHGAKGPRLSESRGMVISFGEWGMQFWMAGLSVLVRRFILRKEM